MGGDRSPCCPTATGASSTTAEPTTISGGSNQPRQLSWTGDGRFDGLSTYRNLAGLQIADALASSLYYAVQVNRYGEVEDKYTQMLRPTFYRHKGKSLGY